METSLLTILGAAFLGGLILNVMPCVLPVLTMKLFHVLEHASDRRAQRAHALAYTGGVLATFGIFALFIIVLRATGESVGWGMQFRNPAFVAALTALIFVFALNALGVFEIRIGLRTTGGRPGYAGSFVNGMFASVMATPCSAPFLGTAAAFALGSGASAWQTMLIFLVVGLGLAAPFLVVSWIPLIGRMLPRPGAWMETFKQLMGFTLLAAAVWLYGVLQAQVTRESATGFLWFLLVLGAGLWAVGRFGGLQHAAGRRLAVHGFAAGVVVLAGSQLVAMEVPVRVSGPALAGFEDYEVVRDGKINWAPFDPAVVERENARNRPVFMDFTADWCANCKTNERLFLETERVRETLQATGILPMKADMTNPDDEIDRWLDGLGRMGIPAYAIYLPDGTFDLLPEVITTELVVERLQAAAAKFPPNGFRAGG